MQRILLLLFLFQFSIYSNAQDAYFTNPSLTSVYLNPAFAGTDTAMQVSLAQRVQWLKLSGSYSTTFGSISQKIGKGNFFIAGTFLRENASNTLYKNQYDIIIKKAFRIGKHFMWSTALELGIFKEHINQNNLMLYYMNDTVTGFPISVFSHMAEYATNVDYSFGTAFSGKYFALGVSIHHLAEPNASLSTGFSPLPLKFGLQLSGNIHVKRTNLQPIIIYTGTSLYSMFQFGLKINCGNWDIYSGCSNTNFLVFSFGYKFRFFRIKYGYTQYLHMKNSGGAHEAGFSSKFWKVSAGKKYRQEQLGAFSSD